MSEFFANLKNCVACIFIIELQDFFVCCATSPSLDISVVNTFSVCSLPIYCFDGAF